MRAFVVNGTFCRIVTVASHNAQVSETIENLNKPGNIAAVRSMIRNAYKDMAMQSSNAIKGKYRVNPATGKVMAQSSVLLHLSLVQHFIKHPFWPSPSASSELSERH